MKELSRIFKALSDETRLQMTALVLHHGELCVCDCMRVLEISQSKASRHLRYLANAGLLDDRREGTWVYYRVAESVDDRRQRILELLTELLPASAIGELQARLAAWLADKERANKVVCG